MFLFYISYKIALILYYVYDVVHTCLFDVHYLYNTSNNVL